MPRSVAMIVAPAVDLREGRCVQWVGGRPETERVSLPDPVGVARGWRELGFGTLHVVDLDAALGHGTNRDTVVDIVEATDAIVQVGGGVRDEQALAELLAAGADRVIVGTRAVDDSTWLERTASAVPERIMVAADVRSGRVLRRGWTEATDLSVTDFLGALADRPIAGVLCTDVAREGRLQGIDMVQAEAIVASSGHPVWISGGIHSMDELRALRDAGAAGAVLGMALYEGALDARAVAEEFGT